MKSLCFIATLAILTSGAIAQDAPRGPGRGGPGGRGAPTADMLKEFDKDGDGKLNDEERQAMMNARRAQGEKMRAEREKEFDKDGDGKLNDEERKAMMDANRERMEQFRKEREKQFDKDGDGKLNDEERAAMMAARPGRGGPGGPGGIGANRPGPDSPQFQEMIKRFDKDGDGKLNDEERAAMREARRAAPPARPDRPAPVLAPAPTPVAPAPAPAAPAPAPAAN